MEAVAELFMITTILLSAESGTFRLLELEDITHLGVTAPTIIHWEGDQHVAGSAEVAEDVAVHGKGLGPFFLNVEQVRMTAGAVEFGGMLFVGEHHIASRRDSANLHWFFEIFR